MSDVVVLGIDPGFTGALAVLGYTADPLVYDAPVLEVASARGTRREPDLPRMSRLLQQFEQYPRVHVFIERVHAMPESSARAAFAFGHGFGAWEGIAVALGYALTRVEPARWKGAMMDGMGKEKDAARLRAAMLFPSVAHLFARRCDDGRAEALLIAEYGRRSLREAHSGDA